MAVKIKMIDINKKGKAVKSFLLFLILLTIVILFTIAQEAEPEGEGTEPPAEPPKPPINVIIPEFLVKKTMTIEGSTEPYSAVELHIDGDVNKGGWLTPQFTGAEGKILFTDIKIGEEGTTHTIKLWVQNPEGITNEVEYKTTIDTTPPDLKLNDIPYIITAKELNITGTVNEYSDISFYVLQGDKDTTAPAKVSGIKLEKADKNLLQFSWTESEAEDFSKYVIYRDNVPIAVTPSDQRDYKSFPDSNVNSNTAYTYQVAAMDKAGNIGFKSDALSATTLDNGFTEIPAPEPIDLSVTAEPAIKINTSGRFNITLRFEKDSIYRIRIEAVDKAKNKAGIIKKILVDAEPPEIEITSPENGAFFFEHYADEIDITGETEPNVSIYLFVERTPFGHMNISFDIAGIPNELQDIKDADLKADCKLRIRGKEYCKTNADYDTTSDSDGNFKFKKVDLTSTLALAMSAQMVSPSDLDQRRDTQESKDARLLFIATDMAGHKGTALTHYRIGTCWSGNFTWETTPLIYMQSPTFLSTERLSEGTETLYFAFNFSYVGTADADTARISSVSLTEACDKSLKNDPRFNHSCNILRSCPSGRSSSDKKMWYFACPLSPLEGMNTWVEKDWKSFFNSITNEMTFPFKVRITYQENGQIKHQTSCEEVTYVVDNSRIDFRKLPDWMLYDAVDFMHKTNEKLTEFTEKYVRSALDWTGMGCMSAYGLKFGATIYRRFTCSAEKLENIFKGISNLAGTPKTPQQQKCMECNQGNPSSFNQLTNECLDACAPKCASAWKTEEKLYSTYRALCDRVFCHTSPAGWTKDKEDQQIIDAKRKETGECGSIDVGVQGQPIRVQGCAQLKKERFGEFMKYAVNPFDQCLVVEKRVDNNKILNYVYTFANQNPLLTRNNIYKLKPAETRPSSNIIYAVKQNEKNYLTSEPLTCEEVCNQGGYKGMVSRMVVRLKDPKTGKEVDPKELDPFELASKLKIEAPRTTEDGKLVYEGTGDNREIVYDKAATGTARENIAKGKLLDGKEVTSVEFVTKGPKDPSAVSKEGYWKCTTVSKCNALNDRAIIKKDGKTPVPVAVDMEFSDLGLKDYKQYKATPSGYTDGCFPGEYDSPAEIITQLGKEKGKEDLRRECCCIGESEIETGKYFTVNDKKNGQPVFTDDEKTKEGYPEFSYRYYSLGLNGEFQTDEQHHLYNPQRYVSGRDKWGCFSQENVFLKPYKLDEDKTVKSGKVMHDPFKSHISAFQCGCISGIYNRVQMVKNILTAMENCLIEVRETGTADSGVCKEIFSQYLCSMMWRAIQYTRTGCIGGDQGTGLMESNNQIASAFGRGMDAVWGSVDEMGTELGQEYGNAKLNNLIGIGEEGVARKACLAAFGYDWDISFREILDTAYAAPMATLVIAPTRSREYLTFNPDSSQATYEYRASWLINPGCDMENYNVYLSCVSGNEISKPELGVKCDDQYSCDCQDLPSEQITNFYDGRSLAANVLEDISSNGGGPKTSPYRYDHLKFVLRPDRAISDNIKENCFPEGHKDGVFYRPIRDKSATDIAACHADLTTGRFICPQGALFWGQKGEAHFLSNEINGYNPEELRGIMEIEQGEPLRISSKIHKADGPDVCLRITVEDEAGAYEQDYMPVTVGGTYTYPAIEVLSGEEMAVRVPGKLSVEPNLITMRFSGNQDYIDGANFLATFYDNNTNEEIELCGGKEPSKDKVKIGDGKKTDIAEICSYNNDKVILSSEGITVEITGVVLPFKSKGTPEDKREESRAYKIIATRSAKKEEFKQITLELVRLKADKKVYNTPDDCNPADIIEYRNSLQRIPFNNKVKVVPRKTAETTAAAVPSYTTGGKVYKLGDKISQGSIAAYEGLPVGSKVEIPDKRIAEKKADGNWYIDSVPYTNTNMASLWIETTIKEIGAPAALKPAAPAAPIGTYDPQAGDLIEIIKNNRFFLVTGRGSVDYNTYDFETDYFSENKDQSEEGFKRTLESYSFEKRMQRNFRVGNPPGLEEMKQIISRGEFRPDFTLSKENIIARISGAPAPPTVLKLPDEDILPDILNAREPVIYARVMQHIRDHRSEIEALTLANPKVTYGDVEFLRGTDGFYFQFTGGTIRSYIYYGLTKDHPAYYIITNANIKPISTRRIFYADSFYYVDVNYDNLALSKGTIYDTLGRALEKEGDCYIINRPTSTPYVKWDGDRAIILCDPSAAAAPSTVTVINRISDDIPHHKPTNSRTVNRIFLHHTGDDTASKTITGFKDTKGNGNAEKSAHYVIDRDGTIYYLVDEEHIAYHAKGHNTDSIGIEIVNTGEEAMKYTDAQYRSVEALGRDIAGRYHGIEWDNEHVKAHYESTTAKEGKWDPSPNFNWSRIGLNNHKTLADLNKLPPRNMGYA